jgi:hypothetical protein
MKLHAGALHVWAADLDAVDTHVDGLLDERERERAERIVREPARRRWMASRGVLRALLGSYLDEHPGTLGFTQEAHGKPKLEHPGIEKLRFNLSHSGGLAVYALSEMGAVGVDVELLARRPSARVYKRELLQAWVRREADGKRLGVGLGMRVGGGVRVGVGNTDCERMGSSQPWIANLDLGSEAVGAVALAVSPVDFRVYTVDFGAGGSILPARKTRLPAR